MIQAANEYDDSLVSNIMLELERLDMVNEFEIVNARDYAETALSVIEERYKNNGQLPGITTGLGKLDDVMLGFEDRKLYVIGARPSQGRPPSCSILLTGVMLIAGLSLRSRASRSL